MAQYLREQRRKCLAPVPLLLPFLFVVSACSTTDGVKIGFVPTKHPPVHTETVTNTKSKVAAAADFKLPSNKSGIDPNRIRIPVIGVDARVIDLGLNPDRTLEVPEDFSETGWWTGGSRPGEHGPAIIVGHLDSETSSAVFYRLQELQPGDEVQVMDAVGRVVHFKVDQLEQAPKDAFPTEMVYGMTSKPTLRLITCGGSFDRSLGHYRNNVIVFASLAEG